VWKCGEGQTHRRPWSTYISPRLRLTRNAIKKQENIFLMSYISSIRRHKRNKQHLLVNLHYFVILITLIQEKNNILFIDVSASRRKPSSGVRTDFRCRSSVCKSLSHTQYAIFGCIRVINIVFVSTWLNFSQNYTVSQKTRHYNIIRNFAKCWPIFKLLSLTDSLVNLQQNLD